MIRNALFSAHERMRGKPTVQILEDLRRTEAYEPERLLALQWAKLRRLLSHAFHTTRYYRELFQKHGIHPDDIRDASDLTHIPVLTKDIIRDQGVNLISQDYLSGRRLVRNATSGSTGQPLVFFTTIQREAALNAAKLRGRSWWGVEMGDRELDLWGPGRGTAWKDRLLNLRDACLNIRLVSAFDLSESAMARTLALMQRWRPTFLYVYPSALYHFTLYLRDQGIDPRPFSPRVIFTSAETLHDTQRALFREFYGSHVANEYGAHDGGLIAFECPAGLLHMTQEQVLVERDGNGHGPGPLIITDLENYGYPFIRYQIGDWGELSAERCPCGRGLAVLRRVIGRFTEMLRSVDGVPVPGFLLTRTFREIEGVREFQAVQEEPKSLRIRIVRTSAFRTESLGRIEAGLKRHLGLEMGISFEFCSALERRESGKCSWFTSRIA
jgi:phenylacetate-CoA ligase